MRQPKPRRGRDNQSTDSIGIDGRVPRWFTLDQDVDDQAATSRDSDGVLELRLPKKMDAAQAGIEVP